MTTPPRRVALVTGAGPRRIGRHVAETLADRGHDIAVHYHHSADDAAEAVRELVGRGVRAEAFGADLADEDAARGMVRAALDRFGRLDVLVNCAAIWEPKPLEEVTAADLRRHFDANILGTFLCAQEAGLAMVGQAEGGCIINVGDWAEARPYPGYAAYFASKGAIPTLTRCLAVELGTRNPRVRVNAILPGPIELPKPGTRREIGAPLAGREGQPEDIARAVLYLVDAGYVTGACLAVDGGRTIYAGGA